ncbi:GtrA family protein [Photobacterium angustum]|uniref:Bactoprenol-linked glucose translocase n=1 Tax=Photobacterium angustum TaxID=661 RepID=A0A2S7VW21_PHOAN|nr:GtrA family protein [Photobacterium angustum]PQJ66279.1 translocase [Photobacterium angustum]
MLKLISKYSLIGVFNTIIHWASFFILYSLITNQSISNFIAFLIAVSFSFFANAKFTFKSKVTYKKYISYTLFLGFLSFFVGKFSDINQISPIITLIVFSMISFLVGFIYSNYFVFKDK